MDVGQSARLFRAAFIAVVALVLFGIQVARKRSASSRLRRMDAGELCIRCGGTELQRSGSRVRCTKCGHVANLDWLQSAKVSEAELEDMTRRADD